MSSPKWNSVWRDVCFIKIIDDFGGYHAEKYVHLLPHMVGSSAPTVWWQHILLYKQQHPQSPEPRTLERWAFPRLMPQVGGPLLGLPCSYGITKYDHVYLCYHVPYASLQHIHDVVKGKSIICLHFNTHFTINEGSSPWPQIWTRGVLHLLWCQVLTSQSGRHFSSPCDPFLYSSKKVCERVCITVGLCLQSLCNG